MLSTNVPLQEISCGVFLLLLVPLASPRQDSPHIHTGVVVRDSNMTLGNYQPASCDVHPMPAAHVMRNANRG